MSSDIHYVAAGDNKKHSSKAKWVIPLFLGAIGLGTYHYMNQVDESVEDPDIVFVDKSEELAAWMDEEYDFTANMAAGRVPSVDMMSRGVNFFNGDSFGTRSRGSAWEFTYTKEKTFSEPFNWLVPDQIIGTPSVQIKCATANGVSEVYSSNSLE